MIQEDFQKSIKFKKHNYLAYVLFFWKPKTQNKNPNLNLYFLPFDWKLIQELVKTCQTHLQKKLHEKRRTI